MIAITLRFSVKLFFFMAITFWVHSLLVERLAHPLPQDLLILCYVFNGIIAMAFLYLLLLVSRYEPPILGWVYLLTSGLKFLLFYAFIYPNFQDDELIHKQQLLTFFIPYSVALFLEIYQLIKILNRDT